MRALVVTADDVGLHSGMTLGAVKAHDEGIVTACSVVANGRAFEAAVEILRDRPRLDAGVHLTLVGERPLSPPERIPSLVDRTGVLLRDFRRFTRRYLLGGIAAGEVEEELRRQIERLLASGLRVVHANSHQHLHVLPRIFEIVLRLAEEHGIPFVRVPHEPAALRRPSPRSLQIGILNGIGRTARRKLQEKGGVKTTARTIGIVDAGALTAEKLFRLLDDAKDVTELVCHPGIGGEALAAEYDWGYDWDQETAALCDTRVKEELQGMGIELTSFSRLGNQPQARN
ncbi:MAG TPA: ChbG/HpnK family deacetylase [Thermoanaerobaculia bacterium]|nr:ChbG/HpnK family deacetylase [Thermoanaerobaculia bacterium]